MGNTSVTKVYPNAPIQFAQLVLTGVDDSPIQRMKSCEKRQVDETFAKLRQLHDELNARLYSHPTERPIIHSPQDVFEILRYFIGDLDHEELWVLDLDSRNCLYHLIKLYQGSVNTSHVRIAEVFRAAVIDNAPSIIIAHNHPSGDSTPSPEDIAVTRAILQAGKLLDIIVLDHLIVTHDRCISLKERGLGFN